MLSSVLSVLAGVLFELGHLWPAILLGSESVLALTANTAQYLALACVAALSFLHRGHNSSRDPSAAVLNVTSEPKSLPRQGTGDLPCLDDRLVDRLFLHAQAVRSNRQPVRHSTSTITARIG